MTVLKPTDLKANLGGVLDQTAESPQYVMHNGQLLVITKAELVPAREDQSLSSQELRAKAIESFYDPTRKQVWWIELDTNPATKFAPLCNVSRPPQ